MTVNKLMQIKDAPAKGQMLLYTRKEVIFDSYNSLKDLIQSYAGVEILEIHLFDCEKEYRAVCSESPRFSCGFIESVSDFPAEDAFAETVMLESGAGTIRILNHISYQDNNGMAFIDDYRLVPGGEK